VIESLHGFVAAEVRAQAPFFQSKTIRIVVLQAMPTAHGELLNVPLAFL
jgi:hypothetical protein